MSRSPFLEIENTAVAIFDQLGKDFSIIHEQSENSVPWWTIYLIPQIYILDTLSREGCRSSTGRSSTIGGA